MSFRGSPCVNGLSSCEPIRKPLRTKKRSTPIHPISAIGSRTLGRKDCKWKITTITIARARKVSSPCIREGFTELKGRLGVTKVSLEYSVFFGARVGRIQRDNEREVCA